MSTAMVGTETVGVVPGQRSGAKIIDSWANVLFLYEEPNRLGRTIFNVRLRVGDFAPWRYGTFETEDEARAAFVKIRDRVELGLVDLFCEVGNRAGCSGNEEY